MSGWRVAGCVCACARAGVQLRASGGGRTASYSCVHVRVHGSGRQLQFGSVPGQCSGPAGCVSTSGMNVQKCTVCVLYASDDGSPHVPYCWSHGASGESEASLTVHSLYILYMQVYGFSVD